METPRGQPADLVTPATTPQIIAQGVGTNSQMVISNQLDSLSPPPPHANDTDTSPPLHIAQPSVGSPPIEQPEDRELTVIDALNYLDVVKKELKDEPDALRAFFVILSNFKKNRIDTPGVLFRMTSLFRHHPALVPGFSIFLPPGYGLSVDSESPGSGSFITVTTPRGTSRRKILRPSRSVDGDGTATEPGEDDDSPARPPGLGAAIDYLQLYKARVGPDLYKQFLEHVAASRTSMSSSDGDVVMSVEGFLQDAPAGVAAAFREFRAATAGAVGVAPLGPEPTLEDEKSIVDELANLDLNAHGQEEITK
ncbi:hypothetical protein DENSPDRAFT_885357 [Dentipellis sp. KUC8613]|nr:hypothetical protein DENSPDRAFT_885357 [Dentipellis sp. KUC8613]